MCFLFIGQKFRKKNHPVPLSFTLHLKTPTLETKVPRRTVPFIFIMLGFGIEENFGMSWCDAIAFLYSLFISSTFFGGLPVAMVRLLFIKYQGFVQFYGEYRVVAVTELMSLITSWGLAVLHFLNKRETERRGFWISDCYTGVKNSGGAPVTHPLMFLLSYGLVTSAQLWAYISIGHYLYNHDKIMKPMLPQESYQKRRRKNQSLARL